MIVSFTVNAPPRGKLRHRNRRNGHNYNPQENVSAEAEIRGAWAKQSGARFDRGTPLAIKINVHVARPASHYTSKGELNAVGRRNPYPAKKPDWDNIAKLVGDGLNGYAYHDDAQIVEATLNKEWCASDETPATSVFIWSVEGSA